MSKCSYLNNKNLRCKSEVVMCITSETHINHTYCNYHYNKLVNTEDIKLEKFKEIFVKHNVIDKYIDVINKYETSSFPDEIKIFEHISKLDAFTYLFNYIRDDIKTNFVNSTDMNIKNNYRKIIKDFTIFVRLFYNKTINKQTTKKILRKLSTDKHRFKQIKNMKKAIL